VRGPSVRISGVIAAENISVDRPNFSGIFLEDRQRIIPDIALCGKILPGKMTRRRNRLMLHFKVI